MRELVGHFDVKVQNAYRMVARIKAPFGVRHFLLLFNWATRQPYFEAEQYDRLWVSNPKAVQHILQTSRYIFVKRYATLFGSFALNSATGRGANDAKGNRIPRLSFDWTQE